LFKSAPLLNGYSPVVFGTLATAPVNGYENALQDTFELQLLWAARLEGKEEFD
jgi:hypothetical protein